MQCPVCGGTQTGKVGADLYFCWSCFLEFSTRGNGEIFEIGEDGNLLAWEPPQNSTSGKGGGLS